MALWSTNLTPVTESTLKPSPKKYLVRMKRYRAKKP
jgi:hypothetical protein